VEVWSHVVQTAGNFRMTVGQCGTIHWCRRSHHRVLHNYQSIDSLTTPGEIFTHSSPRYPQRQVTQPEVTFLLREINRSRME
jgi:hypothetical protein